MGSDGEDYEISVEEVADGSGGHWSHSCVRPDNMSGKERARVPFCADEVANEVADEVVELELSYRVLLHAAIIASAMRLRPPAKYR